MALLPSDVGLAPGQIADRIGVRAFHDDRGQAAWARSVIVQMWPGGIPQSLPALQIVQANAALESGYGQGWHPPCNASNNWGAVQAGSAPPCPSGSCQYTDTHPDSGSYSWCFKVYPSPEAGAADFMRVMLHG